MDNTTYKFGEVTFVAIGCGDVDNYPVLAEFKSRNIPFKLLWEKLNAEKPCSSYIEGYRTRVLVITIYLKDIQENSPLFSLLQEGRSIKVAVRSNTFNQFVEIEYDEMLETFCYEFKTDLVLKAWQKAGCPLFWNPAEEEDNTEEECRATKIFERFEESENLEGNTFYTWQFASYCDDGHNQMRYDLNKLIKKGVIARVSRGFYKILHPKYEY
jgi:hypothetical protein